MSFARSYEQWAGKRTSASVAYHRYGALVVLGAALGNRVYIDMGWGRVYSSLWVCLIGRSNDRKTTAINLACGLLAQADHSIEIPHDFTREALYEILAAKSAGLLRWREMGSTLEAMNRDYMSGVLSTLTDLWDSPFMTKRRTKSGGEIQITWPAVSILGGAKERWFIEQVRPRDIEGGWLGRWLFVRSGGDEERNHDRLFGQSFTEADIRQRDGLVEHLARLTQYEGELAPGEGAAVAETWWKKWQARGWNEDTDPADFAARAGTQVIKLAMALQASEGPSHLLELEPEAVEKAAKLYEYAFNCGVPLVEKMRHHTRTTDEMNKVLSFIRREGTVSRRDVYRKFKMKPRDLDDLLRGMIEAEFISEEPVPMEAQGRPSIIYRMLR